MISYTASKGALEIFLSLLISKAKRRADVDFINIRYRGKMRAIWQATPLRDKRGY